MKFILSILIFFCFNAKATDLYFSNAGNDGSGNGSIGNPYATIAKLNTLISGLGAGDRVLFNGGNIFYGQINQPPNGSSGNPILFTSYGTGKATISGFKALTSWSNLGSNMWSASINSGTFMDVFVMANQFVPMGRTPDIGSYFNVDSHQNYTGGNFFTGYTGQTITSTGVPSGTQSWIGGRIVMRINDYNLDRNPIITHTSNTIGYSTFNGNSIANNNKFFIQNHLATVTAQNEWYYDPVAQVVKMYSTTNPSSMGIMAGEYNFAMFINNTTGSNTHDISFTNLKFTGQDSIALCFVGCTRMVVDNCDFSFVGNDAIAMGDRFGDYPCGALVVDNNTFLKIGNTGAVARTTVPIRMRYNTLDSIGIVEGMGLGGNQQHDGLMNESSGGGDSVVYYGNSIKNVGYCALRYQGGMAKVTYNFIQNFGLLLADGGGIYTSRNTGDSLTNYRSIDHNIVITGIGDKRSMANTTSGGVPAMYNDDLSVNISATNNTFIEGSRYGFFMHNNRNIIFQNNNIFNNKDEAAIGSVYDGLEPGYSTRGINIQNNNVYSNSPRLLDFYSYAGNDISSYGTVNNNSYARPTATDMIQAQEGATVNHYNSLSTWAAGFGYDANSTFQAVSNDSMQIFYNATFSPAIKTFSGMTYRNLQGTNYSDQLILQPFESIIVRRVTYIPVTPSENDILIKNKKKKRNVYVSP